MGWPSPWRSPGAHFLPLISPVCAGLFLRQCFTKTLQKAPGAQFATRVPSGEKAHFVWDSSGTEPKLVQGYDVRCFSLQTDFSRQQNAETQGWRSRTSPVQPRRSEGGNVGFSVNRADTAKAIGRDIEQRLAETHREEYLIVFQYYLHLWHFS